MNTTTTAIVRDALAGLRELGFEATAHSGKKAPEIELRRGSRVVRLRGGVMPFVSSFTTAILTLAHGEDKKHLVIAPYVTPEIADTLRLEGVQFIDGAGNAYLESPWWMVFVRGKRPKAPVAKPKSPRVFSRGGLATTFALLSAPDLVSAPVRAIADVAAVSVGTVAHTLDGLRELGYMDVVRGQRRLFHRERLIQQWVEGYARLLRPKLPLGRFASRERNWWRRAKIATFDAQWGGETAAAVLQKHLVPERTIVYADAVPRKLIAAERLRADDAGDVVVRRRFWKALPSPRKDVVPALLIYADLLAEGDARSMEAAKEIYAGYLA